MLIVCLDGIKNLKQEKQNSCLYAMQGIEHAVSLYGALQNMRRFTTMWMSVLIQIETDCDWGTRVGQDRILSKLNNPAVAACT